MEMTLIVTEWLRRVPDFEVARGYTPQIVFPAQTFGLSSLPLRF
jgi:cytochrome P450